MELEKIIIKPAEGLKIPKLGGRGFYSEGEEVIQTKEVLRFLRSGDLQIVKNEVKETKEVKTKPKKFNYKKK